MSIEPRLHHRLALLPCLLSAALAGLLAAAPAQAAKVTVQSNLADALLLNHDSAGRFSLAGPLSPAGDYRAPYQIQGANVVFSFQDDRADELVLTRQVTPHYTPTAITSRVVLQSWTDPAESAGVRIGTQSATGATQAYTVASHLDHVTLDWHCYANNCPGYVGACNHQLFEGSSHHWVEVKGAQGSFALGYALDGANLATLATTGELAFNIAVGGDLVLQSARLNLDTTPNPVTSVAEPGTAALWLAGLAALVRLGRRGRVAAAGR